MPHAIEVWDRSNSDSDTTVPITLEQLGLESDTESENEQIENTEIQKKQKTKKKKPNQNHCKQEGICLRTRWTLTISRIQLIWDYRYCRQGARAGWSSLRPR